MNSTALTQAGERIKQRLHQNKERLVAWSQSKFDSLTTQSPPRDRRRPTTGVLRGADSLRNPFSTLTNSFVKLSVDYKTGAILQRLNSLHSGLNQIEESLI